MASNSDDKQKSFSFKEVLKVPCLRETYLFSFTSAITIGCVYFMFTSNVNKTGQVGIYSFAALTLSYWAFCRYNLAKETESNRQLKALFSKAATQLAEHTDKVIQQYFFFVNDLDEKIEKCHEINIQHIDTSIDYGCYFFPTLDENFNEKTEFVNILQTCGNMELNKVFFVLASLCQEMNNLSIIGLEKFVNPIVLYGEGCNVKQNNEKGEDLSLMTKFLPLLFDLKCYLKRCCDVVENLFIQLQELFNSKSNKHISNKPIIEVNGVRFDVLFKYLSKLAITLINIEEVLANQAVLRQDFISFKRMMELVNAKPTEFNVSLNDQNKMKILHALTIQIEKEIIDAHSIFRRLIDSIINSNTNLPFNTVLAEHISIYIKNTILLIESDYLRFKDEIKWLGIIILFLIYVWCFRKDDRKLLKQIYECQKRTNFHYIHLKGNVGLYPEKILSKYLFKSMVDKKMNDLLNQNRDNLIKSNLGSKVKQLKIKVNIWLIQFDNLIKDNQDLSLDIIDILHKQMKSIEDGLDLALQCYTLIKNYIFYYLENSQSMLKGDLIAICKLVILAKAIELLFNRKKANILFITSRYTQYYSYLVLDALNSTKKRLLSEVKKYSEKKLDVFSAIILASNCIYGPIMTRERQILTSLCLSLVEPSLNEDELGKVFSGYKKIQACSLIFDRLKKWTNCEFIYFHRSLMGIYFTHCVESELENLFEFRYFFHSFSDCLPFIENGLFYDLERKEKVITQFEEELYELFKTNYLNKLCANLETELRLQVHSHLQLDDQSPFKRHMDNFSIAASCRSLKMLNRFIPLKEILENYLNEITYNLTTIALHDWKTYKSMLNLAKSTYGLEFVTSQLPMQTIEQGLDVLEITRNIHIFVARYRYNLNNQMFIEQSSENKHLNVLLIRHVANSIQTHGFGVINTSVNFTYQFLKRKFHIFSQFLYEDPIKSRLIKDLKYFRESNLSKYPFERAENHVRGIRKLGLNALGQSYLDRFQLLITEIGNALGFVRMLRSGALHCSSISVNFVPDLEDLSKISFKSMALEEGLKEESIRSAENLDTILNTLNQNFTEATNYFELLVQVFQQSFREKDFYHLKNFYIILPALTLNYVEHSIESKEKITRKNKTGAMLTDEGLPMGVAYILKLLDQFIDFDSLQWFSSVKDKIQSEIEEARNQSNLNLNIGDPKLTQTISLTEKRLENLQKEFDLLNYNLTSCRILFRATHNLK